MPRHVGSSPPSRPSSCRTGCGFCPPLVSPCALGEKGVSMHEDITVNGKQSQRRFVASNSLPSLPASPRCTKDRSHSWTSRRRRQTGTFSLWANTTRANHLVLTAPSRCQYLSRRGLLQTKSIPFCGSSGPPSSPPSRCADPNAQCAQIFRTIPVLT